MSVEEIVRHCVETTTIHDATLADYKIEESEDDENLVILHAEKTFLVPELTEKLRKRLIFIDATSASYEDEYDVMYFLHYLEPEEDTFMDSLAEPVSTENSIEAVTREIAENEIDATNSHRFTLGFLAALNCVRQRTSEDGDWTGVDIELLPRISEEDTEARDTEELLERFKRSGRDILEDGTKTVDEIRLTEEYLISEEELKELEERLEGSALDLFQRLVENATTSQFHKIRKENRRSTDYHRIREALQEIGDYGIMDVRRAETARDIEEGDTQSR